MAKLKTFVIRKVGVAKDLKSALESEKLFNIAEIKEVGLESNQLVSLIGFDSTASISEFEDEEENKEIGYDS